MCVQREEDLSQLRPSRVKTRHLKGEAVWSTTSRQQHIQAGYTTAVLGRCYGHNVNTMVYTDILGKQKRLLSKIVFLKQK